VKPLDILHCETGSQILMSKTFQSWKTSHSVIKALHSDALAWIEGRPIPDVEELKLSDSPLDKIVHKA
jgi:hypothetical protein